MASNTNAATCGAFASVVDLNLQYEFYDLLPSEYKKLIQDAALPFTAVDIYWAYVSGDSVATVHAGMQSVVEQTKTLAWGENYPALEPTFPPKGAKSRRKARS